MVSEDSTCTVLLHARCLLLLLLLLAADSREWRCEVCGITFKITCNIERKQNKCFVPIRTRKNPAVSKTHPHQKAIFLYGNSLYGQVTWTHTKGDTSDMAITQPTEHPRTSPPGSRVSEHMPLCPSCVCLPEWAVSQAIATGALET